MTTEPGGDVSPAEAGAGNPSPELVSHLALIAHDPAVRLQELKRYWLDPDGLPARAAAAFAHRH